MQIEGGKVVAMTNFIFLGSKITVDSNCSHEIKRCLFLAKVYIVKAMVFSSSHVWIWELNHKEGRAPKNWCFQIMVLEKTLESLLNSKEIKPVNPKGSQSWIFIGRTNVEAESPLLWPPDVKSWLIGKEAWCWERMKAKGEEGGRGRDGWIASLTQWTWIWANFRI